MSLWLIQLPSKRLQTARISGTPAIYVHYYKLWADCPFVVIMIIGGIQIAYYSSLALMSKEFILFRHSCEPEEVRTTAK